MITHIEIDGFKSFRQFEVDLAPLTVFVGPNGAGKSNLFDAIQLLSDMMHGETIGEAFRKGRGDVPYQMRRFPDQTSAEMLSFAVELLIPKTIHDDLGTDAEVAATRLRYELRLQRHLEDGLVRFYVIYEVLKALPETDDQWIQANIPVDKRAEWLITPRATSFIDTITRDEPNNPLIVRFQENTDISGIGLSVQQRIVKPFLSGVENAITYPTSYAVRQELLVWRMLRLEASKLHTRSTIYDAERLLADGSNLGTVIHRMATSEPLLLDDIGRDLSAIVPGFRDLTVSANAANGQIVLTIEVGDHTQFDSSVVSDGTLRVLALLALKYDPRHQGVLCIEEPENGIHPGQLKYVVETLQALSTDFDSAFSRIDLLQTLVTTHSPILAANLPLKNLRFVYMGSSQDGRYTVAVSILPDKNRSPEQFYAEYEIRQFLDPTMQKDKINELPPQLEIAP